VPCLQRRPVRLRFVLLLRDLQALASAHSADLDTEVANFEIEGVRFEFDKRSEVMGVINLSRDSWYRESVSPSAGSAIQRGLVLKAQGARIVDVGAESTLPDAGRVGPDEQLDQLVPVVEALASAGLLVSVETYEPEVALGCLEAGARLLNLTGTADDSEMFSLAARFGAGVIICFVQGENVREVDDMVIEGDPVPALKEHFRPRIELARRVELERLFIDPGLGFYYGNLTDGVTRVQRQVEIFLNTFRLRSLGYPICHALPHAFDFFLDEVRSAEGMFAVLAAIGGCSLFRTHEVPRVRATLDVIEAIEPR
jgi:dihydropteroate synthase